jgi:hypothetical protein
MITAGDAKIAASDVLDVRFPTSRRLDGSGAVNPDPDYSAADAAGNAVPIFVCGKAEWAIGKE